MTLLKFDSGLARDAFFTFVMFTVRGFIPDFQIPDFKNEGCRRCLIRFL